MGPRNPLAGGEVETHEQWADGSKILRQPFEDGEVFQLVVPRGCDIGLVAQELAWMVPAGFLLGVHNPIDVGDHADTHLYLSVWVPKEEKEQAKAA